MSRFTRLRDRFGHVLGLVVVTTLPILSMKAAQLQKPQKKPYQYEPKSKKDDGWPHDDYLSMGMVDISKYGGTANE